MKEKSLIRKISTKWLLAISAVVLTALIGVGAALATDGTSVDYSNMSMKEIWDKVGEESLTYVFTGDSITHNTTFTQGMNSYPEWFEQYLYDTGRSEDYVINAGWGGSDTRNFIGTEYVDTGNDDKIAVNHQTGQGMDNMVTKYNPDVVFIKLGMNDRGRLDSTDTFIENYNTILDKIYEAGAANGKKPKVVMLSTTPRSNDSIYNKDQKGIGSCWSWRDAAETVATTYSEEHNVNIEFVDLMGAFLEKESVNLGDDYWFTFFTVAGDGEIHPNAAGQYLIFKALSEKIGIYNKEMPIYQYEYEDFNSANLWTDDTDTVTFDTTAMTGSTSGWTDAFQPCSVWVVAGGEQISAYPGTAVNRSMFRLMDNTMRRVHYDIRMIQEGSTDAAILNKHFDNTAYGDTVLLLIPEVDTSVSVDEFTTSVKNILDSSNADVKILWTPLASGDDATNESIAGYAEAVRGIVAEEAYADILFFDANEFMTTSMAANMAANESLKANWFEDATYLSPVGSTDVTRAFFTFVSKDVTELKDHNLRLTSDARLYKTGNVRDYIEADAKDNQDGTISIDISAILENEAYSLLTDVKIAWLPELGAGDFNENIRILEANVSGNVYTVTTPCDNPVLAVYGDVGDTTYRFKDLQVEAKATTKYQDVFNPDGVYLNTLEVVGAETEVDLTKETQSVELYQYQKDVQVRATAQDGLEITVNGEPVESGALSQLITVDKTATVEVTVSDKANGNETSKTYTLNLARPDYADIIVTEVLQAAGYNYDLIEVYNASGEDLNLLDYSIGSSREYPPAQYGVDDSENWPYYFVGNRHLLGGAGAKFTCINQITKGSSYWAEDDTVTEVPFPAGSTMVIWVKYDGNKNAANETYESLIAYYKTLTNAVASVGDTMVLPTEDQLVVAEIPKGQSATLNQGPAIAARSFVNLTEVAKTPKYFYLDNFGVPVVGNNSYARNWLFVLDDEATMGTNGAITEDGNDIISASMYIREDGTNLSTKFNYDIDRGLAVAESYLQKTTFGAVEYFQKPYDLADTTKPTVVVDSPKLVESGSAAKINITMEDDTDVRYMELYVRKAGQTSFTKVAAEDYVLASSVANSTNKGVTTVSTSQAYTYALSGITDTVEYYGYVLDGNNNKTTFGTEKEPLAIQVAGDKAYLEKVDNVQAEYRTNGKIAPKAPEGYIFAGWYADMDGATALTENFTDDTAYAKFVSEKVLSIKAQVTAGTKFDTTNPVAIRFVTSVDSLNYKKVGFDFVIFDENNTRLGRETTKVYENLYGLGSGGKVLNYMPQHVFDGMSQYFMAYTLTGITNEAFGHGITARPYWITLDGTKVYGVEDTKTTNMAYTPYITDVTTTKMGSIERATEFAGISGTSGLSTQGGCTDGTYYYQAIMYNHRTTASEDNYSHYSDDTVIVQKYKLSDDGTTWTDTNEQSDELALCHANDMTYNEDLGMLVICHGLGDRTSISFMNPETLEIVNPAELDLGNASAEGFSIDSANKCIDLERTSWSGEIWSIDYNSFSNRYVVGISGGQLMRIMNSDFTDISGNIAASGLTPSFTTQSLSSDDNYIYSVLYNATGAALDGFNGHVIAIYDWDGNYITTVNISTDAAKGIPLSVEPENISVYNNHIYIACAENSETSIYKVSGVTLSEDYVASITKNDKTEYYFTLESALMNAEAGDTITVLDNVTVDSSMSVLAKNVTITNAENADVIITRGESLDGVMFDNRATGFAIKENTSGSLAIDGNGANVTGDTLIENAKDASMTLENITISNVSANVSGDGAGAVYSAGDLTVTGSTFENNKNNGRAGALYLANGTTATITDSKFASNEAALGAGGAIFTQAEVTISNTEFASNQAGNNGGAICCSGGNMTVTDCTFDKNSSIAENGGAVAVADAEATITGTGTFTGNGTLKSGQVGGAIYVQRAKFSAEGYTFDNNSATHGGAIYINSGAVSGEKDMMTEELTIGLTNLTFTKNNASTGQGGAVHIVGSRKVAIKNCNYGQLAEDGTIELDENNNAVYGNVSAGQGGALWIGANAVVDVDESLFAGNRNTGASAGALYSQNATLNLTNTKFIGNSAKTGGGAINATGVNNVGTKLHVTSCTFEGNISNSTGSEGGGALSISGNSTVTFDGTGAFSNNSTTCSQRGGGAIHTNNATITIEGAYTFKGNEATDGNGGAIYIHTDGKPLNLKGATFEDNTAAGDGDAIYTCKVLNVTGSDFTNNSEVVLANTKGAAYVSGKLTGVTFKYTQNAASVLVGDGGIDETSTITIQPIETAYVANTAVLSKVGNATAGQLANAADVIKVVQTVDPVTTDSYWHISEEGALLQGANDGVKVGTGYEYESLAEAINGANEKTAVADGTTLYIMNDLTETASLTIDRNITLKSDPLLEDGITITRGTDVAAAALFNITSNGALEVRRSITLDGNSVEATKSLIVNAGTLTIGTNVIVQNAINNGNGGAISNASNSGAEAYLYGDFTNNISQGAQGGAVRGESGCTVYIEGSTFTSNQAVKNNGGAVAGGGTFTIKNSLFVDNKADGADTSKVYGGAIANNDTSNTTIEGCTFQNNSASTTVHSGGGAIFSQGVLTIRDYVTEVNGQTTTVSSSFTNNKADDEGGAIRYTASGKTLTISGSTKFTKNSATFGGVLYNTANTINMTGAKFTHNSATGGGVLCINHTSAVVTATDCVFENNTATENGGAIYMIAGSLKLLSTTKDYADSKFEGNISGTTKDGKGGAIFVTKGTFYVGYDGNDATTEYGYAFNNNQSNTYHGGAINLGDATVVVIDHSEFNNNTGNNGGAINAYTDNKFIVRNTTFTDNTAKAAGGAIMFNHAKAAEVSNCTFKQNESLSSGQCGGAITIENAVSNVTISSSTFEENQAISSPRGGGAVYVNGGTLAVRDTSFAGNKIKEDALGGTAIYIHCGTAATVSVTGTSLFAEGQDICINTVSVEHTVDVNSDINVEQKAVSQTF